MDAESTLTAMYWLTAAGKLTAMCNLTIVEPKKEAGW